MNTKSVVRVVLTVLGWTLALAALAASAYLVGRALQIDGQRRAARLSDAWLSIQTGKREPLYDGGLILPPGSLITTVERDDFPQRARLTVTADLVDPRPFELGVGCQGLVTTAPVNTPASPVPFYAWENATISIDLDGESAHYLFGDEPVMNWSYAGRQVKSLFLYTQWATLRLKRVALTGPDGAMLAQLEYPALTRRQEWRAPAVAFALLLAIALLEQLLARFAHLGRAPTAASLVLTSLPLAAGGYVAAKFAAFALVATPLALTWLAFRLRYWAANTSAIYGGLMHRWRLIAAVVGCLGVVAAWHNAAPSEVRGSVLWAFLVAGATTAVVAGAARDRGESWRAAWGRFAPFLLAFPAVGYAEGKWGSANGAWLLPAAFILLTAPLTHQRANLRRYGLWMLALTALTIASLERAVDVGPLGDRLRPANVGTTFATDQDLFWVPKDLFGYSDQSQYRDNLRVKRIRFRGHEEAVPGKAKGVTRILALGGSNVWGDGQDTNDTAWVGLLEKRLRERGYNVQVLNGGVKGYNVFQALVLLERYAINYEPDIVIVYVGFNDVPNPYGLYTYREVRDGAASPPAVRRVQQVLRRSSLYNALTRGVLYLRHTREKTGRFAGLKPMNPEEDFAANLRDIVKLAHAHGAKVLLANEFYGVNFKGADENRRGKALRQILAEVARQNADGFLDVWTHFADRPDPLAYIWPHDTVHFNNEGHAEMGALMADYLTSRGWLGQPGTP